MIKGKLRVYKNYLQFYCPGCELPHTIRYQGEGKGDSWTFDGNYEAPTISPSVLVKGRVLVCHLFLKNGMLEFLGDCTHDLKSQTVELPEMPDPYRD